MSGNFARGLLPFLPGVANTVANRISQKDEIARRKRMAGALTPPGAIPDAPQMTNLGVPSGPQLEIPQETLQRQALGEQVRQPQNVEDMLASGYQPSDVLQVYKALPMDARSDFQDIYNNEKVKYQLHGADAVDPYMAKLIEQEIGPKPFNPLDVGSTEEARIRGAQGLMTPDMVKAIEDSQPKPAPKPISSIDDALGRLHAGEIDRPTYDAYVKDWSALETMKAKLKQTNEPPKPEKPAFDVKDAFQSVQTRSKDLRDWLAKPENSQQVLSKDEWKALSPDEQSKFTQDEASKKYFRPDPAVQHQIDSLNTFLSDPVAMKRAAGTLLETLNTKDPSSTDLQAMAEEMKRVTGITDIDPTDPAFPEVYRRWKEKQDALLR